MEDGRVIRCYFTNFSTGGQQTGLNLTNLKLLKLRNAVKDSGNRKEWRRGPATPSTRASSTQAALLTPVTLHTWSKKKVTWCSGVGSRHCKKGSNTTTWIKGRRTLVLARAQLPLLTAARRVVPHLTIFTWVQPKELESNQQSRYVPGMAQSN